MPFMNFIFFNDLPNNLIEYLLYEVLGCVALFTQSRQAVCCCSAEISAFGPVLPGFSLKLINKLVKQLNEQALEQATNEMKVGTPIMIVLWRCTLKTSA